MTTEQAKKLGRDMLKLEFEEKHKIVSCFTNVPEQEMYIKWLEDQLLENRLDEFFTKLNKGE